MATLDRRIGGTAFPAMGQKTYVVEKSFDASVDTLAQNDIVELLDVPAKSWVHVVVADVATAEGSSATAAIGDGDSATGYIAAADMNSVASSASGPVALTEGTPNTVTGYSGGKYYDAAGVIQLKALASGGLAAAKVTLRAVITDLS